MQTLRSIRPFIGAKDFKLSRAFYRELSFEEKIIDDKFSYFHNERIGFYLQDYYVKYWIDNLMLFIEVDDAQAHYDYLLSLDLSAKFPGAKLSSVRTMDWGSECFLHDPSGVLWHFGAFHDR